MFSSTPFYHQSIRKSVVAFGSLFNDIYINMEDEILRVPLAYAPKQKWYNRIKDGKLEDGRTFSMTLPRMGFDIISYTYDSSRKRNTMIQVGLLVMILTQENNYIDIQKYHITLNLVYTS